MQAKGTFALIRTLPHRDAFVTNVLPAVLFAALAPPTNTASATASRFHRMMAAQPPPPHPDTAPLSERLACLKDVLNICLQFELSAPAPTIRTTVDFGPHMALHVDPAIAIIWQELEVVQEQVAADPNMYRRLLASLSTADRIIYDECFGKTVNADLGGDATAYAAMLQTCAELKVGCTLVAVHAQPTAELMPLVLQVREHIPAYKQAIEATVAEAASASGGFVTTAPTISFRHETKAPYRIIEKALTKGPNREYPETALDCSKVLDVL